MKKFIGITLILGLTVAVFVVDRSEDKANLLTVESECLFLDKNIVSADNLFKLKSKEEKNQTEDFLWMDN